MCGIAGVLGNTGRFDERKVAHSLKQSLRHRGPDDDDHWSDGDSLLVHTRLSIIDLTPTGAQPMVSRCGRYVLVFNGEIYNYRELAVELVGRGIVLRGTSDTEVLLELLVADGERALHRLDGMFAFAFYDSHAKTLLLARDPLGEKPLYYAETNRSLCFASEVRALLEARLVDNTPCLDALASFLVQGSLPAPWTHVKGVKQLPPGCLLWAELGKPASVRAYYRLPFLPERDALTDPEEAYERVENALRTSIERRLRADVPIAAFLSGGVDSSLVCALLAEQGVDVTAFTVTMPGQPEDESLEARKVARALGIRHETIEVELDSKGAWLDDAMDAMDLPSVDGPNTWLVSRAVKAAGFKVACSGVGGDELFFGYSNFRSVARARRLLRPLSPLSHFRSPLRNVARRLPGLPRVSRALEAGISGASVAALWFATRGLYGEAEVAAIANEAVRIALSQMDSVARLERLGCPSDLDVRRQVSFFELRGYMHDQLLRDSDVMSMSHGIELRLPLLGLPVVEAALSLNALVLAGDRPKWMLKRALETRVPGLDVDRPKQGFALPWRQIMLARSSELNLERFRAGAYSREMSRLETRGVTFARLFALEVGARKFSQGVGAPAS